MSLIDSTKSWKIEPNKSWNPSIQTQIGLQAAISIAIDRTFTDIISNIDLVERNVFEVLAEALVNRIEIVHTDLNKERVPTNG